ncbi:MAG: hypothetical protein JSV00_01200 [bacterium]|nr:MAG: hypothetical protein JSV00_01200 [bacterium]
MRLPLSVFWLSASTLSYEIIVIRVLARTHWQPFVTLAISTALLGFGLAGTLMVWSGAGAFGRRGALYPLACALAALSFRPVVRVAEALDLIPGLIFSDPGQWLSLGGLIGVLTLPFVFASYGLALPLLERESVGKFYGSNLAGACAGVALALGGMELLPPQYLAHVPSASAGLACLLALSHYGHRRSLPAAAAALAALLALPAGPVAYGPYKDISYALLLPDSRTLARSWGAAGLLEVVGAPAMRTAPGLSTRFRGPLPPQAALYRDGDRVGTLVLSGEGQDAHPPYLQWQTAAAPYVLFQDHPRVVVLGFDGGEEALRASASGAGRVQVIEPDAAVHGLVRDHPGLFPPGPGGRPFVREVGLVRSNARWRLGRGIADIVVIPLAGNLASAVAGFGGAEEDYLLTAQGLERALEELGTDGVLAITGWKQEPPTGRMKILATIGTIPGFQEAGQVRDKVRVVTGWSTYTMLVSRKRLERGGLSRLESFCSARGFLLWTPGEYGPSAAEEGREGLDLRPATDARPYPWHTLGAGLLLKALGGEREEVLPRMEWGLLFLVMALALALAFILLFVLLTGRRPSNRKGLPLLVYFGCLGVGYMVVEILVIKRSGLLIPEPARAAALVVAPFLIFSGLGSFAVIKVERSRLAGAWVFPAVALGTVLLYLAIPALLTAPEPFQPFLLVALTAPLALIMGLPFPLGLRVQSRDRERFVPWAWALSGYTSTLGSALAGVMAVFTGLGALVALAAASYLAAGVILVATRGKGSAL